MEKRKSLHIKSTDGKLLLTKGERTHKWHEYIKMEGLYKEEELSETIKILIKTKEEIQ